MKPILEQRLQAAARRLGLRLAMDRCAWAATDQTRYYLRPYWDARCAVRVRPDGNFDLAHFWANGRRRTATQFSLEEVETFLARWSRSSACAPARLPSQAVTKASADLKAASRLWDVVRIWGSDRSRPLARTRGDGG
jgi:hypothetical protein